MCNTYSDCQGLASGCHITLVSAGQGLASKVFVISQKKTKTKQNKTKQKKTKTCRPVF